MARLWKKEKIKYFVLFIIVGLVCALILAGEKSSDNDMIYASLFSHYITLILNNLYIIYMYQKAKIAKQLYDKIIPRIGQKNFFQKYLVNSILDITFYLFITYFILYLKLGINMTRVNIFIVFLLLTLANFLLQEFICLFSVYQKKAKGYIILPVLMNLLFHYYLVSFLVNIF